MCLTIKGFRTRKEAREFQPFIAKKDIKVYKVLNVFDCSPYRNFKYEKGYHYSTKFTKYFSRWVNWVIRINSGLHAYRSFTKAEENRSNNYYPSDYKVVTMYIPAGSKYYKGINGDIVSDNLIWY